MTTSSKILADSVSHAGVRLTTWETTFPRIILAEVNTHRMLCLAGDAELEFDLPGGQGLFKRVYRMRLDEFVDKWLNGARRTGSNPKKVTDLSWIEDARRYSTGEAAARLGFSHPSSINKACRDGVLEAQRAADGRTWVFSGSALRVWREMVPDHTRFDMRAKLSGMQIRQLNEHTGDIQSSFVVDAMYSGVKLVYEVRAGDFTVAGSKDHRILTTEGWRTIEQLQKGDRVVVRKFGKHEDEKADPLRLRKIDGVWRSQWQRRERERLISQDPLCRRCRCREGETVHHIVPVHQDPSRALDPQNIVLLCEPCHNTQHETQGWQGGTYLYGSSAIVEEVVCRGEERTYDLTIAGDFPNFLANGVVVHNSRNSASSRAIPVAKMIARVQEAPYVPRRWGRNQAGMQAAADMHGEEVVECEKAWLSARDAAVKHAMWMLDIGLHKQLANRVLEPWVWHTAIISATELDNFFHLRDHPDAHPDFQDLARMLRETLGASDPRPVSKGEWHTPLLSFDDELAFDDSDPAALPQADVLKASVGRCARVSYLTHNDTRDLNADVVLCEKLLASGHLSPLEHVARPATRLDVELPGCRAQPLDAFSGEVLPEHQWHGNFRGWVQYRKTILNEEDMLR